MKLDCGPTRRERIDRLSEWHLWFAWRPVRIGSHDCRWLETVQRRGAYWEGWGEAFWDWEYRSL